MAEKKLIPVLRFPGFEGEWGLSTLSDLLTFKNGINASKEDYGKGYKFINVLDIIENDFITHDKIIGSVNISEEVFRNNIVEYGDILFQRSSETREEVGQANAYLDNERPATFGGFVIRGKKKGEYDAAFMNALLKTDKTRKEITSKSGGSTRYNVGQDTLSKVIIHIPELLEQQKIASFLSAIDQRIQLLQKKKDALANYKIGVMQKIFNREIRFKDENGNDYPDWEEKKLREVGTFFSGGTPLTTKPQYFNGQIPFIRSGEINADKTEQFISDEGLKNSAAKIIQTGDLIYALYGATSGEVAISKIKGAINQAILCIRSGLNNIFLLNYLRFKKQSILKTYLQGGQGNLSAEIIKSLEIPIPCFNEQQKIASFLSAIDESIKQLTHQIAHAKTYKKGLLQKMFV